MNDFFNRANLPKPAQKRHFLLRRHLSADVATSFVLNHAVGQASRLSLTFNFPPKRRACPVGRTTNEWLVKSL
jgi:hypothetical protein